jgi:hypothetical protein
LLPALRGPIVLVTGDSDAGFLPRHAPLLEHPSVAHVFAQNCELDARHPRLSRLPIGIDNPVYTKLDKRLGFAVAALLGKMPFDRTFTRNDIGDQALLQRIASALPPNAARPARALCTFHQNQKLIHADLTEFPERADAVAKLRDSRACHFVPRRLRQAECWMLHGEFAFQVSPRGRGLDCFRTWESLALGVIPIVLRSPLTHLFAQEALPVLVVDDWTEITPERLAHEHAALRDRFDASLHDRLGAAQFIDKIHAATRTARTGR